MKKLLGVIIVLGILLIMVFNQLNTGSFSGGSGIVGSILIFGGILFGISLIKGS